MFESCDIYRANNILFPFKISLDVFSFRAYNDLVHFSSGMRILLGCIMGGNSKWYNILYTNSMPLIWNFTNLYFTFRIFILHFSQQLRHMLQKPLQKLEKHQTLQELFLLLTCYPRVTVPSFSITNDNSAFWKKGGGGVVCPQNNVPLPWKSCV